MSAVNQSVAKWKGDAWMCMWGIIRAVFASAQLSLCDEQPAVLGGLNNSYWGQAVLSSTVHVHFISYNIDKSVLMWSHLERIICPTFKMMVFDWYENCLYQKCSIECCILGFFFLSSARNLTMQSFQKTEGKPVFILPPCWILLLYQNPCVNGCWYSSKF